MRRELLLTALAIGLAGRPALAGTLPPPALFVGPVPPPVRVGDARPEADRKGWRNLFIFSCNYGVWALGDEAVSGRMDRLAAALTAGAARALAHRPVVVEHYGLYLNMMTQIRGGAYAETYWPKCAREKMAGGWFSPGELTTHWSPLTVELTATVDGRPLAVHAVFSPPKNLPGREPQGLVVASDIVLDQANAALVRQILAAFPDDLKGGQ